MPWTVQNWPSDWKSWAQQLATQSQNSISVSHPVGKFWVFLLWNIQLVYSIIKQIQRAENKKSICTAVFLFSSLPMTFNWADLFLDQETSVEEEMFGSQMFGSPPGGRGRRGTGCRAPRPGAQLRPPWCPEEALLSIFTRRARAAVPHPRKCWNSSNVRSNHFFLNSCFLAKRWDVDLLYPQIAQGHTQYSLPVGRRKPRWAGPWILIHHLSRWGFSDPIVCASIFLHLLMQAIEVGECFQVQHMQLL